MSFTWDTFSIEKMIGDKMVRSSFLCYNIDTDLPFMTQNSNLWVWGFFYLFRRKTKLKYNLPMREGEYACVKGLLRLFF